MTVAEPIARRESKPRRKQHEQPTTCPSCSSLPVRVVSLPRVAPYLCEITRERVIPQADDYRCTACNTQWNERERKGGTLHAAISVRH